MTVIAVTVYTPDTVCMACRQTKRHLERRGIPYTEVSISGDETTIDAIRYLGFRTAPIVCVATDKSEQAWDGYRPDRINALVNNSERETASGTSS